jgi:autotransporter-associated beta strand protein
LDLATYSTTAGIVTVLSGAITGSGTAALSGSAYNVQSGLVSANLGDLGGSVLTKTTDGILVLSGSNGYQGGTIVSNGTLILTNNAAIADGTNLTIGNPSAFAAPVVPSPVAGIQTASSAATIAPVPEPGTLVLLAAGAICAAAVARRRKK